ncbi:MULTISPECIES: LysR family transcriptional regulator [unclassified Pseudomonas]|uniref:LysR family transcriptional regulator n=1 Tax=unclassified Pseudomonas TaxID=196821 RepID=UPI002AC8A23B|nr:MULTISPECIES: LysR family transcriptional regulator [unclassified Pseudomonas]MEB0047323.1 LysR family transcriptional regulator [Pseudomonas sp. Dout3]MEB0096575.1 LysR family transcriptional regulator [Pseudomonas sp. DC1.2]WPX60304.1 LysR family transcriptional regulator [Pseudomonas sp. DC1.2]
MNQLAAMRAFRCIVEAKGFSAAAERLDTTHSTISRQLQQLEIELGVQLINRNTRRFSLTTPGEQYYAACVDILERVQAASQAIAQGHQRPEGLLRVGVPLVVGTIDLPHWLPAFQKRYPDIELELCCDDQFVDVVAEGFDVAIRIASALSDTTLIARTLTVSKLMLVAAPGYVRTHGLPRSAEELKQHRLLTFVGATSDWELSSTRGATVTVAPTGQFKTNTIIALHAATVSGAGIACFTQATVRNDLATGLLVSILPNYSLGERHYYAVYPQSKYQAPKVRAFVDFLADYYQTSKN